MDIMKERLKQDCERFYKCTTLEDCSELLDMLAGCLFAIVMHLKDAPAPSDQDKDSRMILQMMLTKILHLKGVIQGVSFKAKNNAYLNNLIDPTIVTALVRNIYETVGVFHLIFINTKTDDERNLLYNLWVHSGLKNRQMFASTAQLEESFEKLKAEKKEMDALVVSIKENPLYVRLDTRNREIIDKALKDKRYLIKINGDTVKEMNWQDLAVTMKVRTGLFDNAYTYFCLHAHPSNVAVFQFHDMFKKDNPAFKEVTMTNCSTASILFSMFIADYIKQNPEILNVFNSLDIRDQIVIGFYNTLARGRDAEINNAYFALEG